MSVLGARRIVMDKECLIEEISLSLPKRLYRWGQPHTFCIVLFYYYISAGMYGKAYVMLGSDAPIIFSAKSWICALKKILPLVHVWICSQANYCVKFVVSSRMGNTSLCTCLSKSNSNKLIFSFLFFTFSQYKRLMLKKSTPADWFSISFFLLFFLNPQ